MRICSSVPGVNGFLLIKTLPEDGRYQSKRRPARVDFPAPDGPIMARWVPEGTARFTSSKMLCPEILTFTPSMEMEIP